MKFIDKFDAFTQQRVAMLLMRTDHFFIIIVLAVCIFGIFGSLVTFLLTSEYSWSYILSAFWRAIGLYALVSTTYRFIKNAIIIGKHGK